MPKKSPIAHLIDQFSKDYGVLSDKVIDLIEKYIRLGQKPEKAIENAIKELRYFTNIEKLIENNVLKAGSIGYGSKVLKDNSFTKIFNIRKSLIESGIDLSIKDEILVEIKKSRTYLEIANQLVDTRDISNKLPKYLEQIIPATKRNFKGRSRSRLNKAIEQVSKLAQNGAPNRRLKNSYLNLIKQVESENEIKINSAIRRAMKEKARYRAERIARTEIARAQGIAFDLRTKENEDVVGVKYTLSTRHKIYDICDFHTSANLYGMGAGVYPKDLHPPYPFHPHCLCVPSEVFVGEARLGKFDDEKAKDWIKSRSIREQRKLLGIEGRERFKKTGRWKDKLRNWREHEKPDLNGVDESFFD